MVDASVVVSTYNQEKYICDCLESILAQKTNFNFEIIVANDCSTDRTAELISKIDLRNPGRLSVLNRARNLGAAGNYVDAHDRASGSIVFHFDGDDLMLPGKLQKQFDVFAEHAEVNVVFHRAIYFSDEAKYSAETGTPRDGGGIYDLSDLARWGTIAVHGSYAYRRDSRKTRKLEREFMEWFFAIDSLLPNAKFGFLDEVLCKYRVNPGGQAYTSTKRGRRKAYILYFEDLKFYFQAQPALRLDLYANCLVTFLGMLKNGKFLPFQVLKFLAFNIKYFRLRLILDSISMRSSVAPSARFW